MIMSLRRASNGECVRRAVAVPCCKRACFVHLPRVQVPGMCARNDMPAPQGDDMTVRYRDEFRRRCDRREGVQGRVVMIMSLRGAFAATWQSHVRGAYFAHLPRVQVPGMCVCNDMPTPQEADMTVRYGDELRRRCDHQRL
jgi:hypothetical protein